MEADSRKRPPDVISPILSTKKRKILAEDELPGVTVFDWQAALGSSLAEQLETLTIKRKLTTRQVKKLLRAVLTNEDVVAALRRYITLGDAETGEPSGNARKHPDHTDSVSQSVHVPITESLEPRVITRSLARTIQYSLRDYFPQMGSSTDKTGSTILDMEFSGDDDEDSIKEVLESDSSIRASRDEDYHPGPVDFQILEQDRIWDSAVGDTTLESSQRRLEDSTISVVPEEVSQQSAASNDSHTATLVERTLSSPEFTSVGGEVDLESGSVDYSNRLRSRTSEQILEDNSVSFVVESCPNTIDGTNMDCSVGPSDLIHTADVDDSDADVYAEFLRSLYSSINSAHTTPSKEIHVSENGEGECKLNESVSAVQTNLFETDDMLVGCGNVEDDEDPDDPEFDVMAELDNVDREDFFDELRDDRAVRVSKWEARSLHQDLHSLFSDEEEETQKLSVSDKPRAAAVLAMKSHCHRLLRAKRFLKHEYSTSSVTGVEADCSRGDDSLDESQLATNHCLLVTHPRLTEEQLVQLQRQLGMHVQQLTTNFICTYDFPRLHTSVTRVCASALKELASRRDAFDIMAQQRIDASISGPSLHSFYWSCSSLDDAIQMITDYAGLSILPQVPRFPSRLLPSSRSDDSQPRPNNSLPLPICLINLMMHNPIWSYPFLMPSSLPPMPDPERPPASRRRLAFHASEDALILLGLADFSRAHRSEVNEEEVNHSRYLTYRLVHKHLLPHRNLLQLRTRRWNLLSSRFAVRKIIAPKIAPLATRRLLQLYSGVAHRSSLDRKLLHALADEVAVCSVPRQLPLRSGCLVEISADELFRRDGLPRQAGYESALLNLSTDKPCRGEFSKHIHDTLTDFVQQSDCLWWSKRNDSLSTPCSCVSIPSSSFAPDITKNNNLDVIKPEESDVGQRDPAVLGPTFLPAIPVDVSPDGTVVLNTKAEPALVELNMPADQPVPSSPVSRGCHHLGWNRLTPIARRSVSAHVEDVLTKLRNQTRHTNWSVKRKLPGDLISKTIEQLAAMSPVAGKLPLPRLNSTGSIPRRLALQNYRAKSGSRGICAKQRSSLTPSTTTTPGKQVDANTVSSSTAFSPCVTTDSISTSNNAPPNSSPTDSGIVKCQKVVDSLAEQFHLGLNKLIDFHGNTVLGTLRFRPTLTSSSLIRQMNQSSYNPSLMRHELGSSVALVDRASVQYDQPTAVFPNKCYLSGSRFLTRCKARGEATSADLFLSPSSVIPYRQSAVDEMDVHRARSLLDRCRAYLPATDYAAIVLALRKLNQIVYSAQGIGITTSTQYQKDVLRTLHTVLNILTEHKSLWEDFVCLLTADQAKQLGVLSSYMTLVRIGRVQRVLQDLIPRSKRFWRRLRNLADSCDPLVQRSLTAPNDPGVRSASATDLKANHLNSSSTDKKAGGTTRSYLNILRTKGIRTKFSRFPIPKSWAFLKSTWRNRPILLSQLACLLNDKHKPYSGFEHSFEEIDLLSRNPLGKMESVADESWQSRNVTGLPVDLKSIDLSEGWEFCTALASATSRCHSNTSQRISCSCPCHTSSSVVCTAAKSTKPVDSYARHCFACSLKVHNGVVYADTYNFRMRDVQITWPADFKPKSHLKPASDRVSSHSRYGESSLTTANRPSVHPVSSHISTRAIITQLAEQHAQLYFNALGYSVADPLADIAKRRISIEFLSSARNAVPGPVEPGKVEPVLSDITKRDNPSTHKIAPLMTPSGYILDKSAKSTEYLPSVQSTKSPESNNSQFYWLIDDDAACFNTEAFAPSNKKLASSSSATISSSPTRGTQDMWYAEEDRQLLEFSKARGVYSSSMFVDLANQWIPKPDWNSRARTSAELECRFKQLMRVTLGDAYDSDLFHSPDNTSSESEA